MEVIAHEHIRMQPPSVTSRRFIENGEKRLRRAYGLEEDASVVTTVDHVVSSTGELDPQPTRHRNIETSLVG